MIDKAIGGGLDRDACNVRIEALRTEARDLRDKQRAFETVLDKLDSIEGRVEALLTSAEELLTTWELLEPAERRARLQELVSVIVVSRMGSGGGNRTRRQSTSEGCLRAPRRRGRGSGRRSRKRRRAGKANASRPIAAWRRVLRIRLAPRGGRMRELG